MINHTRVVTLGVAATVLAGTLGLARTAQATVVEFQTVLGNISVNLFDETTPLTVANFLNYVNNGAYTDSFIHRLDTGFVAQGGGFVYSGSLPVDDIVSNAAVNNEPLLTNARGTIAMAKIGGDPNSATNQWFFNLADNSANLDNQNGGFTVFGVVMGNGMDVVDAIAALPTYNFGSPLGALPLRNYTATDATNGVDPDGNHFVLINAIVVTDTTVSTNLNLLPADNITIAPIPAPAPTPSSGGGGGGGLGVLGLLAGLAATLLRRRR